MARGLLDAGEIYKLLQQSLARKLLDGFTWRQGSFRVLGEGEAAQSALRVRVPQLVLTGVLKLTPLEEVTRGLQPLFAEPLGINPAPWVPPEEVQLRGPAEEVLAAFAGRALRMDELAAKLPAMAGDDLGRVVYALSLLELLVPASRARRAPSGAVPVARRTVPSAPPAAGEDSVVVAPSAAPRRQCPRTSRRAATASWRPSSPTGARTRSTCSAWASGDHGRGRGGMAALRPRLRALVLRGGRLARPRREGAGPLPRRQRRLRRAARRRAAERAAAAPPRGARASGPGAARRPHPDRAARSRGAVPEGDGAARRRPGPQGARAAAVRGGPGRAERAVPGGGGLVPVPGAEERRPARSRSSTRPSAPTRAAGSPGTTSGSSRETRGGGPKPSRACGGPSS